MQGTSIESLRRLIVRLLIWMDMWSLLKLLPGQGEMLVINQIIFFQTLTAAWSASVGNRLLMPQDNMVVEVITRWEMTLTYTAGSSTVWCQLGREGDLIFRKSGQKFL